MRSGSRKEIFPNIYEAFGQDTARMELFPLYGQIDVEHLKHSFPKYFDSSVTQEEFDDWMERFYGFCTSGPDGIG